MLCDYLSTITEGNFTKVIASYLLAKESAQFKEQMHKHSFMKAFSPEEQSLMDMDNCLMDCNNFDQDDESNQEITDTEISNTLWENLMDILHYCKENNRMEDLLINYKKILKVHVDNSILIDVQCFNILFYCTEPSLMEQVFNNSLIREQDLVNVGILFERDFLFLALDLFGSSDTIDYLRPLIISLTILIYKSQSQRHAKNVCKSLENKLAVFINKEVASLKNNKHWCQLKYSSIKHLLKAVYLNGIFQIDSMSQLLANRETAYHSDSTESDTDSWPTDSDDSDDEEEEEGDANELGRMIRLDVNNNVIEHRRAVVPKLTFGDRINFKIGPKETSAMFPMTLKSLARLRIKALMPKYTAKNVAKLNGLPRDLQRFVLFQDEIDAAIKSLVN